MAFTGGPGFAAGQMTCGLDDPRRRIYIVVQVAEEVPHATDRDHAL